MPDVARLVTRVSGTDVVREEQREQHNLLRHNNHIGGSVGVILAHTQGVSSLNDPAGTTFAL